MNPWNLDEVIDSYLDKCFPNAKDNNALVNTEQLYSVTYIQSPGNDVPVLMVNRRIGKEQIEVINTVYGEEAISLYRLLIGVDSLGSTVDYKKVLPSNINGIPKTDDELKSVLCTDSFNPIMDCVKIIQGNITKAAYEMAEKTGCSVEDAFRHISDEILNQTSKDMKGGK